MVDKTRRNALAHGTKVGNNFYISIYTHMIGAISFTKLGVSIVLHYIISGCSFDALIAVAMDYFSMQVRLLTGFISNH